MVLKMWLGLGLWMGLGGPVWAQAQDPVVVADAETLVSELARADVIYLGEIHDDREAHNAQLDIIQLLFQQDLDLAIGMEMFQRPFQSVLDDYIAGDLSDEALRRDTEYDERWGFEWEFYTPILRFAQQHQLPVIALNTPQEVTQTVAAEGLATLEGKDLEWIPDPSTVVTEDPAYTNFLLEIFEGFHQGVGRSDGFNRFVEAQVLWDETMADTIVSYSQDHPETQMVVLAGQGHLVYGYGIPSRVERRSQGRLQQQSVLINPPEPDPDSAVPLADYLYFLP